MPEPQEAPLPPADEDAGLPTPPNPGRVPPPHLSPVPEPEADPGTPLVPATGVGSDAGDASGPT